MKEKGWKPIPLSLKIVAIVSSLWFLMAIFGIGMILKNGFPFLGIFTFGLSAIMIVLLLYLVAPIAFLFALWNRYSWTAMFALSWIGFFLLNSAVAILTNYKHFASSPNYFVDLIANIIFFTVIYRSRNYFT